ncbi:MAG: patatin-like phospholipase family protein, partial [Anaerolineales bacterium]
VLGSMAVPGIFPPRKLDAYTLIDGGVLDPVPVRPARALAPGLPVVAVSLLPPLDEPSTPSTLPLSVPIPLVEQITRLSITQAFRIFIDAVDIGQRQMTELRLKLDEPDVIIRPEVGHINILERVDVHKVARLGERAAQAALPELEQAVSLPATLMRQVKRITQRDEEET